MSQPPPTRRRKGGLIVAIVISLVAALTSALSMTGEVRTVEIVTLFFSAFAGGAATISLFHSLRR
jgi:uncharacterized membrane-anchored protein